MTTASTQAKQTGRATSSTSPAGHFRDAPPGRYLPGDYVTFRPAGKRYGGPTTTVRITGTLPVTEGDDQVTFYAFRDGATEHGTVLDGWRFATVDEIAQFLAGPDRLSEHEVLALVDQLAARADLPRPAVGFLPRLDDRGSIIKTSSEPERSCTRAQITIAKPALPALPSAAVRYLLTCEIGWLRSYNTHWHACINSALAAITTAFPLAGISWWALLGPSLLVAAAAIGTAVLAWLGQITLQVWQELNLSLYGVMTSNLDHIGVERLWDYAVTHHARPRWLHRLRRWHLHQLVAQRIEAEQAAARHTAVLDAIDAANASTAVNQTQGPSRTQVVASRGSGKTRPGLRPPAAGDDTTDQERGESC